MKSGKGDVFFSPETLFRIGNGRDPLFAGKAKTELCGGAAVSSLPSLEKFPRWGQGSVVKFINYSKS